MVISWSNWVWMMVGEVESGTKTTQQESDAWQMDACNSIEAEHLKRNDALGYTKLVASWIDS